MNSFPGEVWILLVGVLLVGVRLLVKGRGRRWRALAGQARVCGWRTARLDREDLPFRYGHLDLMRRGYNRRCSDVILAETSHPARAFCYHYETGFGKRHASWDLTVAVVETDRNRPGVWVGSGTGVEPAGVFGRYRLMENALRREARADAGPPSARLYAESPSWVDSHLRQDLLRMLQQGGDFLACEIRGPHVALYERGIHRASLQIELLRRTEDLVDRLDDIDRETSNSTGPSGAIGQGQGGPTSGPRH